jgi:hypothetical protein
MNGRVYDPLLGRFGVPDPMTENPLSTQGWNRYSYVGNSPVNFTDPTGYCFMGCFWQPIFRGIQNLFRQVPILGSLLQIGAGILCSPIGLGPVCATLAAAFVSGVTSGKLGVALRTGFITAVTAAAFFAAGELTGSLGLEGVLDPIRGGHGPLDFMSDAHIFNIAAHALVGCASAVASRGKCGAGALSGGVGSFAGPLLTGLDSQSKLVATSVVGGLASVAGGGKFANGAVTAAFGYLFNEMGAYAMRGTPSGISNALYGDPSSIMTYPDGTPVSNPDDPRVPLIKPTNVDPARLISSAPDIAAADPSGWGFVGAVWAGGQWDFQRANGEYYPMFRDFTNYMFGALSSSINVRRWLWLWLVL